MFFGLKKLPQKFELVSNCEIEWGLFDIEALQDTVLVVQR